MVVVFFFFKQKTAYEMRISDWSSDVCSSDLSGTTLITDELPEALGTVGTGFSLLDFIEQTIAQAEASQQEFGETFDGGRQGEFRELLVDTEIGRASWRERVCQYV